MSTSLAASDCALCLKIMNTAHAYHTAFKFSMHLTHERHYYLVPEPCFLKGPFWTGELSTLHGVMWQMLHAS